MCRMKKKKKQNKGLFIHSFGSDKDISLSEKRRGRSWRAEGAGRPSDREEDVCRGQRSKTGVSRIMDRLWDNRETKTKSGTSASVPFDPSPLRTSCLFSICHSGVCVCVYTEQLYLWGHFFFPPEDLLLFWGHCAGLHRVIGFFGGVKD